MLSIVKKTLAMLLIADSAMGVKMETVAEQLDFGGLSQTAGMRGSSGSLAQTAGMRGSSGSLAQADAGN